MRMLTHSRRPRIVKRDGLSDLELIPVETAACCPGCHGSGVVTFVRFSELAKARRKAGIKQVEVAKAAGVSRASVCAFEAGLRLKSWAKIRTGYARLGVLWDEETGITDPG